MEVFIKSKTDFKTIAVYNVDDWEMEIATCSSAESSTIEIADDSKDYTGNWIIIDGNVGLISSSSFSLRGSTALTITDPLKIFDREAICSNYPAITYGQFISNVMYNEYLYCEDPEYSYTYIAIEINDETYCDEINFSEYGSVNLYDVINEARSKGVIIRAVYSDNHIVVRILSPQRTRHNVSPDDGVSMLKSLSMDYSGVSKISIMEEVYEGQFAKYDFYVTEDGYLSEVPPDTRVPGTWLYATHSSDDEISITDLAYETFENHISDHKIEFYSARTFEIFDVITIRVPFGFVRTSITSIVRSSDTNLYLYRCGTLPVTLTDKIRIMK